MNTPGTSSVPIVITATKSDLAATRTVSQAAAKEFCEDRNIPYIETSAKRNQGVNELFLLLARRMKPQKTRSDTIRASDMQHKKSPRPNKNNSCCWIEKCKLDGSVWSPWNNWGRSPIRMSNLLSNSSNERDCSKKRRKQSQRKTYLCMPPLKVVVRVSNSSNKDVIMIRIIYT